MTRGLDFKRMGVLVPVPVKPPKPVEWLTIGQELDMGCREWR